MGELLLLFRLFMPFFYFFSKVFTPFDPEFTGLLKDVWFDGDADEPGPEFLVLPMPKE